MSIQVTYNQVLTSSERSAILADEALAYNLEDRNYIKLCEYDTYYDTTRDIIDTVQGIVYGKRTAKVCLIPGCDEYDVYPYDFAVCDPSFNKKFPCIRNKFMGKPLALDNTGSSWLILPEAGFDFVEVNVATSKNLSRKLGHYLSVENYDNQVNINLAPYTAEELLNDEMKQVKLEVLRKTLASTAYNAFGESSFVMFTIGMINSCSDFNPSKACNKDATFNLNHIAVWGRKV
jgi:hypothetical protein